MELGPVEFGGGGWPPIQKSHDTITVSDRDSVKANEDT